MSIKLPHASTNFCKSLFLRIIRSTALSQQSSMNVIAKGKVSIKVCGLLKHKQLPGGWGVLHDGGGKDNKSPYIELFSEANAATPLHTLRLEHLKFLDKSYLQQETYFVLSVKKEKHHLDFDSLEDKEDWVQALCHVSAELWKQRAQERESSSCDGSDNSLSMNENLLYDSFDKVQQFKVSINPTKASEVNNLQGHYFLSPTRDSLRLLDMVSYKSIHEWPYRQIRKYGRTRNVFRMEVGRRCSTGEGEFEFFTPEGATLTDLITVYTRQALAQGSKQSLDGASHSNVNLEQADGEHVQKLTSSPLNSSIASIPRRASENMKSTKDFDSRSSGKIRERGSTSSVSSSSRPTPAPRSNVPASPNQQNGLAKSMKVSSDTKIYETSSGLTAPLDSRLKNELHNKLQLHPPDPAVAASSVYPAGGDGDSACNTPEAVTDRHSFSEFFKDKKKSDKERKKREKEEAKLKKQQEKEQKEREAKEQKEREKKLKKESKGHGKLLGKRSKSLDVQHPTPVPASDSNIYDEPGELAQANKASPCPPDESAYDDADAVTKPQFDTEPASLQTVVENEYATPEKPMKDSWKKLGRLECEDLHQENYDSIKMACLSQGKSQTPPIPPLPQLSNSLPGADDVEDTYNRLGDFERHTNAALTPQNIYGMASAVETIQPQHSTPVSAFSVENEYEEADTVSDKSCQGQATQQVRDTAVQPQHRTYPVNVSIPDDGDYADVV